MRLAQAGLVATAVLVAAPSARARPIDPEPGARAPDAPADAPRDRDAGASAPRQQPGRANDTVVRGPVRVVLVRPREAVPAAAEALVRIQGELVAEGFVVVVVDSPQPAPPPASPEAPREPGSDDGSANTPKPRASLPSAIPADADALVSIVLTLDADARIAELVVIDRLKNKKLTRWIDTSGAPPDHVAEVLAVRAVELVRASLVELSLPVARPAEPKTHNPIVGLELGTSVFVSPGGVGPAVLGFGRLRVAPISRLELRVAFAGLGTSPRVEGPDGSSARVTQHLVLAEVAVRPWPEFRVRPSFSLGAGAIHVGVEGEAPMPYRGIESATWAAILGGSAGVEVLASPHVGVALELHAFAAIPYPTVRFLGEDAARVASPGMLASVTLVGWL